MPDHCYDHFFTLTFLTLVLTIYSVGVAHDFLEQSTVSKPTDLTQVSSLVVYIINFTCHYTLHAYIDMY